MHAIVVVVASIQSVISLASPPLGSRYLHRDHLGSVVLTSDVSGESTGRSRYTPYGAQVATGPNTEAVAFASFTGKHPDTGSGIYYFGARYFDSVLARFLAPDPAKQSNSPYVYAGAAPLLNIDPDGMAFDLADALISRLRTHGTTVTPEQGYQIFLDAYRELTADLNRVHSHSYRRYHLGPQGATIVAWHEDAHANLLHAQSRIDQLVHDVNSSTEHNFSETFVQFIQHYHRFEQASQHASDSIREAESKWAAWLEGASPAQVAALRQVQEETAVLRESVDLATAIWDQYGDTGAIPHEYFRDLLSLSDSSDFDSWSVGSLPDSFGTASSFSTASFTLSHSGSAGSGRNIHYTVPSSPPGSFDSASSASDQEVDEIIRAIERNTSH